MLPTFADWQTWLVWRAQRWNRGFFRKSGRLDGKEDKRNKTEDFWRSVYNLLFSPLCVLRPDQTKNNAGLKFGTHTWTGHIKFLFAFEEGIIATKNYRCPKCDVTVYYSWYLNVFSLTYLAFSEIKTFTNYFYP